MYLNDIFTVPVNLAGLPLGVQLIGKPFDEQTILNAAFALESALK